MQIWIFPQKPIEPTTIAPFITSPIVNICISIILITFVLLYYAWVSYSIVEHSSGLISSFILGRRLRWIYSLIRLRCSCFRKMSLEVRINRDWLHNISYITSSVSSFREFTFSSIFKYFCKILYKNGEKNLKTYCGLAKLNASLYLLEQGNENNFKYNHSPEWESNPLLVVLTITCSCRALRWPHCLTINLGNKYCISYYYI